MNRKYDVIVWGCTGFTGKLVCEYIKANYPALKWAIAGRSEAKVGWVKTSLKLKESVGVVLADIKNTDSLVAMASQTTVILSTAGPFDKIGSPIVDACVKSCTNYCDITGEPQWIRKMIDAHADDAAKHKIKIVNCCGFDCIPSDLGCQMLCEEMARRSLNPVDVRFIAGDSLGGASGGTLASVANMFATVSAKEMMDVSKPYYLHPDKVNRPSSSLFAALLAWCIIGYDAVYKCWTMPYVMQTINIPIVNRSNALLGWQWGKSLKYSEVQKSPAAGPFGALIAVCLMPIFCAMMSISFTRNLLFKFLPQSGEGPNDHVLNNGFFNVMLWGTGVDRVTGKTTMIKGSIHAPNGDPGYR